jgi:hypothetical protein
MRVCARGGAGTSAGYQLGWLRRADSFGWLAEAATRTKVLARPHHTVHVLLGIFATVDQIKLESVAEVG